MRKLHGIRYIVCMCIIVYMLFYIVHLMCSIIPSQVLTERKTQLETGDHFKAHLYKRTGSSWKKKWCQLKGCIFSYTKSVELIITVQTTYTYTCSWQEKTGCLNCKKLLAKMSLSLSLSLSLSPLPSVLLFSDLNQIKTHTSTSYFEPK